MLKKLAIVVILFFTLISYSTAENTVINSFDENYFVGLKAFEDGFYDVSKKCFKDYLLKDEKSSRAGFVLYLLYQVYMEEGDFSEALHTFNKLGAFKDKRFDLKKMQADHMYILTKLNCGDAEQQFLSTTNDIWLKVYLKSSCSVSENIVRHVVKGNFSTDSIYLLMDDVGKNKEYMTYIYSELPSNKKTAEFFNYFGKYFAANKMMKEFWQLYNVYKDADLVSIALDDVWNQKNYPKYVDIFNNHMKKNYKLKNTAYCRMIEASNKNGNTFDCDIIDGCLDKTNPKYTESKLTCYIKNEDKLGISNFMKSINIKDADSLCEYAKYMVGKNLYSSDFLDKFSGCSDKSVMYEILYKNRDAKGLINLIGKSSKQIDLAYLAVAYFLVSDKNNAEGILQKIYEPQFIEMVKERTGLVK